MYSEISKLEVTVNGKIIQLICDKDTSTASIKESIFQFLKYVGNIEDHVKLMQDKAEKEAKEKAKHEAEEKAKQDAVEAWEPDLKHEIRKFE